MIGIVFIGDLKYCPYLSKYTQILDEEQQEYEILFWNREDKLEEYPSNYISFNKSSMLNRHPVFKVWDFLKFKSWLNNQIFLRKYDKLIILSTLSGMLIAKTLVGKYKCRYIFDIRDYSYEMIKPFYKLEEKLIRNSYFTCISSEGFKKFLPKNHPYIISHNFNYDDLEFRAYLQKKKKGSTLNVTFNGAIRYFDYQSQIIKKLKNDHRYNMIYHGTGSELDKFISYFNKENINNLEFTGPYKNSDKHKLLHDADILNNSYGSRKEMEIKYAISNKYYDGLIFGIPQLVEIGTFKEEKVKEIDVGIGLDIYDQDFADKLYNYYFEIDEKKFNENCGKELKKILKEDEEYLKKIKEFISK